MLGRCVYFTSKWRWGRSSQITSGLSSEPLNYWPRLEFVKPAAFSWSRHNLSPLFPFSLLFTVLPDFGSVDEDADDVRERASGFFLQHLQLVAHISGYANMQIVLFSVFLRYFTHWDIYSNS